MQKPKIIQIATDTIEENGTTITAMLFALMDDGTIWAKQTNEKEWTKIEGPAEIK